MRRTCCRFARRVPVRRHDARRLMAFDAPRRRHRPGHGRTDRGLQLGRTILSREEQDEFSARSHPGRGGVEERRVRRRGRSGDHPLPPRRHRGQPDEGVRGDTTVASLARLRPAFREDGTITAGSASQISDGAAAVVVMEKGEAERRGLSWIAEIGAHGVVAGPDSTLQEQPRPPSAARARRRASRRPTSTWWRSTRPSPRWASPRRGNSASTAGRSTSTVERSPSGIRSARPGPGSPSTSPWSSGAVAAGSERRPCAEGVGRATP